MPIHRGLSTSMQYILKVTTGVGSAKLIFSKLTGLVSLEQSLYKPVRMYGGGLLKLALGDKWGSSLPLEQRASIP